jgi:hypothetical protein
MADALKKATQDSLQVQHRLGVAWRVVGGAVDGVGARHAVNAEFKDPGLTWGLPARVHPCRAPPARPAFPWAVATRVAADSKLLRLGFRAVQRSCSEC